MPGQPCRVGPWSHGVRPFMPVLVAALAASTLGCTQIIHARFGARLKSGVASGKCPISDDKANDVDELIFQGDRLRDEFLAEPYESQPSHARDENELRWK